MEANLGISLYAGCEKGPEHDFPGINLDISGQDGYNSLVEVMFVVARGKP